MKKAAKVLALFLGIFMVVTMFSSCSEDVYAEYKAALDKTNALTEIDGQMNISMNMEIDGSNMAVTMGGNVKAKGQQMLMDMKMEMMGNSMDMLMYYADGVMYSDTLGIKTKVQMPYDQFVAENSSEPDMIEFTEDFFTDVKFEKVDGGKKVSLVVDGDKLNDKLLESLNGMQETLAGEVDASSLKFSNVSCELVINGDGYIDDYKLKFDMAMKNFFTEDPSADDIIVKAEVSIKYNNPGSAVTIDAPKDLDQYQDASDFDTLG